MSDIILEVHQSKPPAGPAWVGITVILLVFTGAFLLTVHAVRSMRVPEVSVETASYYSKQEWAVLLDLQIEHARNRLKDLDPGPPPAWYAPSYYYDWMPKARLYGEVQDGLKALQQQKREMEKMGDHAIDTARTTWNTGVAPVLHLLLALTLFWLTLRWFLRFALWREWFGWKALSGSGGFKS